MQGPRPRIGLVGCVKTKLARAAPARDLYVSDLFRGRRAHVERSCERWFILSAKHRLLEPDAVIEPYELSLGSMSEGDRRRWSREVLAELGAQLGTLSAYEFELHAGDEYRSYGLRDGLDRAGALSVYPVAGLSLGEQLRFYSGSRPDSSEAPTAPEPPAGPAGGSGLMAHPERAREAARRLWRAWRGDGVFGISAMPESELPHGVERGSRAHALFVTLTVALDYMRSAEALWTASREAASDTTRWLFEPAAVAQAETPALREALVASGIAMRPDQDTRIWQTVSRSLLHRFEGDPREIAERVGRRAPAMIAELRRTPGDFPWLQGQKIAPLWVRMMADEVGLSLHELDQVPIPVDVHIARTTFACGALVGSLRGTVSEATAQVQEAWRSALGATELSPLQIDQALWLQSREGCSQRRGDVCPREGDCVLADLCVAGRIGAEGDLLVIDTRLPDGPSASDVVPRPEPQADLVWERIRAHAGEPGFLTRQGRAITYDVDGDHVVVRNIRQGRIPRDHLARALTHAPFDSLWDVPADLWGRSYIFAILMDPRIRGSDW